MSQETTTQPIMNDSNYANDSNPKPEPLMYDALARHSYLQKARTGVACPMNDRNAQCGVDVSKKTMQNILLHRILTVLLVETHQKLQEKLKNLELHN